MGNDAPHAIAPDGAIIQLTSVEDVSEECKYCYMQDYCDKNDMNAVRGLLGIPCTEIDTDNDTHIWKRVDDD